MRPRARPTRIAWTSSSAALACAVAAACTAFDDVPLPGDRSGDAGGVRDVAAPDPVVDAVGPVVLPAPGFVTLPEAVQACTVIAACPHLAASTVISLRVAVAEAVAPTPDVPNPPYDTSFSYCVEQLSKTYEPNRPGRDIVASAIHKIAEATSCADAGKNLFFELLGGFDSRCPADAGNERAWICVDDVTAILCDSRGPLRWHCNAPHGLPSGKCVMVDAGGERYGGCIVDQTPCFPQCTGTAATYCTTDPGTGRSVTQRFDCSTLGLECAIDPGTSNVGCTTPGRAARIDPYFYPGAYCDNTELVLSNGSFVGVLDCASIGGVCASDSAAAVCTMPDAECTPFSAGANACQGSKIRLCVGGRWQDVECPQGCDSPDGSPRRGACRATFDGDGG